MLLLSHVWIDGLLLPVETGRIHSRRVNVGNLVLVLAAVHAPHLLHGRVHTTGARGPLLAAAATFVVQRWRWRRGWRHI